MSLTLKEEIENYKKDAFPKISKEVLDQLIQTTNDLVASGIHKKALKQGDKIPSFELKESHGCDVSSTRLLQEGPLVLSFYRGGWCPYCSMELRALQNAYPSIKEFGANLVAVSPEIPQRTLQTVEKNDLNFTVLSDTNNQLAKSFGLVFELIKQLANLYRFAFDLDLKEINGSDKYELPIPATYVIDKAGTIQYAFVDADYTKRMEPQHVLDTLKNL